MNQDLVNQLKVIFADENVVVYVYGSSVNGRMHSESDVDVAVVGSDLSQRGLIKKMNTIDSKRKIDARLVNSDQSPVYLSQIIRSGKAILIKDEKLKTNFEVKAMKRYYDLIPYLEKYQTEGLKNYFVKK